MKVTRDIMYILEISSVSRERRAKRNVERNNGRKIIKHLAVANYVQPTQ